MRRGWWGTMVVGMVLFGAGAGDALACMTCDASLHCAPAPFGGQVCFDSFGGCLLMLPCMGTRLREPDAVRLMQLSIVADDAASGSAAVPARVARGNARVAVGRRAVALARGGGAGTGGEDALVFSALGHVETSGTLVFRAPAGDGFTLRCEPDGRGSRIAVHELAGTSPGRVLASERVGEDDALVVRITFGGRPCVLVVQSPTLPSWERQARERGMADELAATNAGRTPPTRPPFELKVIEP